MKKVLSLVLVTALVLVQLLTAAFVVGAADSGVILDAYSADQMRVPYFGIGAKWVWDPDQQTDGLGPHLLSFEGAGDLNDDTYCVTGITTGSILKIENVDFGDNGPEKAYIRAGVGDDIGFTMEVRLDAADGTLLGTFTVTGSTSMGWGGCDAIEAEFDITEAATGVHTLYLVNTAGAMNFHGVHFDEKAGGQPVDPEPVEKQVDAYVAGGITVQTYGTAGTGILTVESGTGTDGGYVIEGTGIGTTIKIAGVDFGETGAVKAAFLGNTGVENGFAAELRLDAADGTLLGTFERTTATEQGWGGGADQAAAEVELDPAVTGVHDVYVVFTRDAANFFGVTFTEGAGEPVDPEPVEKQVDAYVAGGITVQTYGTAGTGILTVESGTGTDGGYVIEGTGIGTTIKIAGVDFGETGAVKAAFLGNTGVENGFAAELRLDAADGTLLGTFERTTATEQGWGGGADQAAAEVELDPAVTGVHDVYIVITRDAANFFGVTFTEGVGERELGDVNGDSRINSSDARLVLQHTVELITLDETQQHYADVNEDNAINSMDARAILQKTVS